MPLMCRLFRGHLYMRFPHATLPTVFWPAAFPAEILPLKGCQSDDERHGDRDDHDNMKNCKIIVYDK
jgi:hypothetical protein